MPAITEPRELERLLIEVPIPPLNRSFHVKISVPHEEKVVAQDDAVMRHGATVDVGSSAVIGPPASEYTPTQEPGRTPPVTVEGNLEYRTIGYFHRIEQYLERGLLQRGLHVTDRTKFEANLRDQLEIPPGQETPLMLKDIPEAIRSVQATGLKCDYILQVNEVALGAFEGEPLHLGTRPEVQKASRENPGLRVGEEGSRNAIPLTLRQPWLQARLNGKLIDVQSGSIDWIGEHTLESLNILDAGLQIRIDIRKRPTNATSKVSAANEHNLRVRDAYKRVSVTKRELVDAYRGAMSSRTHEGTQGEYDEYKRKTQSQWRQEIAQAKVAYADALSAYNSVGQSRPPEAYEEWTFEYDVDEPIVTPDLLRRHTSEEERLRLEHEDALLSRLARDLLLTIETSEAAPE